MRLDPNFTTELANKQPNPQDCYISRCVAAVRAWEWYVGQLSDEKQQGMTFTVRLLCGEGRVAKIKYLWNPGFQRAIPGALEWS